MCRGNMPWTPRLSGSGRTTVRYVSPWGQVLLFVSGDDAIPGTVGSAGNERVDKQLVAIASGDVQRRIAVLVHAVDLSA